MKQSILFFICIILPYFFDKCLTQCDLENYESCTLNEECVFINRECYYNSCYNNSPPCPDFCFDGDFCRVDECFYLMEENICNESGYGCEYNIDISECRTVGKNIFLVSLNGVDDPECEGLSACKTIAYIMSKGDGFEGKKLFIEYGNYVLNPKNYTFNQGFFFYILLLN
jgi:hypothetical protein